MGNITLLDCTLRDGGRIIDCKFEDKTISNISKDLVSAGIDIIEIGFLRDDSLVEYKGNSTFFTEVSQIRAFIPERCNNSKYSYTNWKLCILWMFIIKRNDNTK